MFFEFFLVGIKWTIGITYSLNVVFQLWWKTIGCINIHLRTIHILLFIFYFFCNIFFPVLCGVPRCWYMLFFEFVCSLSIFVYAIYFIVMNLWGYSDYFFSYCIIRLEFLGFWYMAVMLGIVQSCVGFFNNNKYFIH